MMVFLWFVGLVTLGIFMFKFIASKSSKDFQRGAGVYAGWVLFNFICLMVGKSDKSIIAYYKTEFFPFTDESLAFYDSSELLLYIFAPPVIVFIWNSVTAKK